MSYGVLPLRFADPDPDPIEPGDVLRVDWSKPAPPRGEPFKIENTTRNRPVRVRHELTDRQIRILAAGGLINEARERLH